MIEWKKGCPPKIEGTYLFIFKGEGKRIVALNWVKRHGSWCPYDGYNSYVSPSYYAEVNYPEKLNGES